MSGWCRGSTGPSSTAAEQCHRAGPVPPRHAQHAHLLVRQVLARVADVAELDDDGLRCGAGGADPASNPSSWLDLRAKLDVIVVRCAFRCDGRGKRNPGCAMHSRGRRDGARPIDILSRGHTVRSGRSAWVDNRFTS